MKGFDLALDRLVAAVEGALDAAAAHLAAGLPGGAIVEADAGRRQVVLRDGQAAAREFGTAAMTAEPFLVPLLAEAERELAALVTEALHLEP